MTDCDFARLRLWTLKNRCDICGFVRKLWEFGGCGHSEDASEGLFSLFSSTAPLPQWYMSRHIPEVPFSCVQIRQLFASFNEFSLWQVVRTRPFLLTVAFIITANAVLSSDSDPALERQAARGIEVYMGIEVDANPDVDSNQMVDQSGWAAVEAW